MNRTIWPDLSFASFVPVLTPKRPLLVSFVFDSYSQDKVTLKLFTSVVQAGKLEQALDLVDRLHLEKSYDIAVTVADRLNYRSLSDRVYEARDRRFAVVDDDEEEENDDDDDTDDDGFANDGYDYNGGEFSNNTRTGKSVTTNGLDSEDERHGGRNLGSQTRAISPDTNRTRTKKRRVDDYDSETDMERNGSGSKQPRRNPFARKTMGVMTGTKGESTDGTGMADNNNNKTTTRPLARTTALSRLSSFSAQSRRDGKAVRQLL